VATGYGRYLLEVYKNTKTITEIKAVARGAKAVFPNTKTIIDIGGQDTKVISLNDRGDVTHFEMNDRCAAGTGKFLEIMAKTLGYDLEIFGQHCLNKNAYIRINSLCTVFAESEVISLITKGEKREAIAHSLHDSIASRVMSLIKRIEIQDDVIFTGGCAINACLKSMFEERLQRKVFVHDNPYLQAAHGAALYAMES
jgi:predicted CoA-substrate-specific enzyme activase